MADKQPMQASGDGAVGGDGVDEPQVSGRTGGGESGGGAYPNPHAGKDDHPGGGFMGHGGQTDVDYSGTGADGDPGAENANAATGSKS
jgi:hypothetical protein